MEARGNPGIVGWEDGGADCGSVGGIVIGDW
jgi:hypothetical protein